MKVLGKGHRVWNILYDIFMIVLVVRRTLDATRATRILVEAMCPKATKRAYDPKIAEYEAYAEKTFKEDPDWELVTGERLFLFLSEKVIGRKKKRGGGEVGIGTIKQYISAITKKYKIQCATRGSSIAPPREDYRIRDLLTVASGQREATERMSLRDRFKNSFLDGPSSTEELVRISDEFMRQGRGSDLKHRLAAILSLSAALRGQTTRHLEIADLAMLDIPSDGPQQCPALVMIIRKGKTNHFGKIEYGSGLRNKHAELCVFGALALSFFWRYHIANEPFPDFSSRKNWHFIKVIPGSTRRRRNLPNVGSSGATTNDVDEVEEEAEAEEDDGEDEGEDDEDEEEDGEGDGEEEDGEGEDEGEEDDADEEEDDHEPVTRRAEQQAHRDYIGGLSAKEYERIRVSNPEIDYQSQLKAISKVMNKLRISSTAKTHFFRHASAKTAELQGVSEDDIRRLGRWNSQSLEAVYLSPIALKAARALAGFRPDTRDYGLVRAATIPSTELQDQIFPQIEAWESSLSLADCPTHLFALLKFLRVVLLQDAVILMRKFPDHRLFKHEVFGTAAFREFYRDSMAYMDANPMSVYSQHLSSVAPEIVEAINNLSQRFTGDASVLRSDIIGLRDTVNGGLSRLDVTVSRIATSAETERNNSFRAAAANLLNSNILTAEAADLINAAVESISNPADTAAVPNVPPLVDRNRNSQQNYTMSRSLSSVSDIWKEYDVGLNGRSSIKELNRNYGARWRNSERDRSFYRSAKIYYTAIEDLASTLGISPFNAANRLETFRNQQHLTLAQFREQLKENGSNYYVDSLRNIADS